MFISRREGFSTVPIAAGTLRGTGAKPARTAETGSFDQISLGQETNPTFRSMAAALSQQVRTYNTTARCPLASTALMPGRPQPGCS